MRKPPSEFMKTICAKPSNPLESAKLETLKRLQPVMKGRSTVLVGAFARDMIYGHACGIDCPRATFDIDISVGVASWSDYRQVCADLIQLKFKNLNPPHTEKFTDANGQEVDLLPFGGLAEDETKIRWPDDDSVWTISGIQEACDHAWCFQSEGLKLRVAPPCALIYLKFFAANDRPEDRKGKDPRDIYFLLKHYADVTGRDRLLSSGSDADVMPKTEGDQLHAAAWLAGRDMRQILSATSAKVLASILRNESAGQSRCPIAREITTCFNGDFAKARALLQALRNGFEESPEDLNR